MRQWKEKKLSDLTLEQNIRKLLHDRIDVTTISKSKLDKKVGDMQLKGRLHISKIPLSSYTRHILITRNLHPEFKFISRFCKGLEKSIRWKIILEKYGL